MRERNIEAEKQTSRFLAQIHHEKHGIYMAVQLFSKIRRYRASYL